jgi:hypothetical protein
VRGASVDALHVPPSEPALSTTTKPTTQAAITQPTAPSPAATTTCASLCVP